MSLESRPGWGLMQQSSLLGGSGATEGRATVNNNKAPEGPLGREWACWGLPLHTQGFEKAPRVFHTVTQNSLALSAGEAIALLATDGCDVGISDCVAILWNEKTARLNPCRRLFWITDRQDPWEAPFLTAVQTTGDNRRPPLSPAWAGTPPKHKCQTLDSSELPECVSRPRIPTCGRLEDLSAHP